MRTLTSVQSANYIKADLIAEITLTDQSTTFQFGHTDIVELSGLSWEIPFAGGFGKPSNYNLTVSSSLQLIKENITRFPKAEVSLRIDLNEDIIFPHVGRIQSIQRNGTDPNLLTFRVYDKLLDANPSFPIDSIVDSYSTVHPEVIRSDFGYPRYYGKHTRPFFFTPVDCSVKTLLGPLNVSSHNHVNSIFYNSQPEEGTGITGAAGSYIPDNKFLHLINGAWDQQSGSTNTSSNEFSFEVTDWAFNLATYRYNKAERPPQTEASSKSSYSTINQDFISGNFHSTDLGGGNYEGEHALVFDQKIQANILQTNHITYTFSVGNLSSVDSIGVWVGVSNDTGFAESLLESTTAANLSNTLNTHSLGTTIVRDVFSNDLTYHLFKYAGTPSGSVNYNSSVRYDASIKSESYLNYSIYSTMINCSDVAISENPIRILDDILDVASIEFVAEQSSSAQVSRVSSHSFQCFFGERQPITQILDDFSRITGTYTWIADSGMINYRTYEESGTASIDAVITTSDMMDFVLKENPLGVTQYESEKAKRVKVDYGFDFITGKYLNTIVAEPTNTALCNSAQAKGIDTELVRTSKYIMETDTASYYLGNLVRRTTQSEEFAELVLPARYFGLELADIVKIQHPMIIGSESLYQVTAIRPDYINGSVFVRSTKLLSLNGS